MRLNRRLAICGLAAALCVHAGTLAAQDSNADGNSARRNRGNFDPAQFQQRMLENVRTKLAFTNDAEWAAVQPIVQKIMDARMELMASGMGFGRMNRRSPEGGAGNAAPGSDARAGMAKPNPEADSLQKLIDDKVPVAEIKAALEKYRASRKDKEAKLAAAQEDLRNVLTVRQEAQAALLGLLP